MKIKIEKQFYIFVPRRSKLNKMINNIIFIFFQYPNTTNQLLLTIAFDITLRSASRQKIQTQQNEFAGSTTILDVSNSPYSTKRRVVEDTGALQSNTSKSQNTIYSVLGLFAQQQYAIRADLLTVEVYYFVQNYVHFRITT